jgi:hypothetical protein
MSDEKILARPEIMEGILNAFSVASQYSFKKCKCEVKSNKIEVLNIQNRRESTFNKLNAQNKSEKKTLKILSDLVKASQEEVANGDWTQNIRDLVDKFDEMYNPIRLVGGEK